MQGIPTLPELKLRYYELMITYYQHYHNYLEICRCYKAIYESEGVQADAAVWVPVRYPQGFASTKALVFVLLSADSIASCCTLAVSCSLSATRVEQGISTCLIMLTSC
eukprot:GHUV01054858.1.p1 GENE.GHUV01054858.1~~GHUV01054858.1.p1  ORF type:complete len:108 (-),score=18.05 GHUV01054858.1:17-340(-)